MNTSKIEEIEVFEGRFQATKEQLSNICDNYVKNRYFDGIKFLEISIQWEENRRVYYGMREYDDFQAVYTRTLGYVEVTQLLRFDSLGVRVRIVCLWPPLLKYWEELPEILGGFFPKVERIARVQGEHGKELIDLTSKKPGRKGDSLYDDAFRRLQDGEDNLSVFQWFCTQGNIINPDKHLRDSFKAAMKRRQNKS